MEAAMIWTVVQGVFSFLISLWPFTPAETINMLIYLVPAIWGAFGTKDWANVKKFVRDKCLEAEDLILSNEDKTNLVVDKAWEFMPKKVKVLPWVTKELLKTVVISQYTSVVKPTLRLTSNKPVEAPTDGGFSTKSVYEEETPIVDLAPAKPKLRISDDGESMVVDDRPPVNLY